MNEKLKNSPGLKLVFILGLILLLLIPSVMIQGLITERETRRNEAVNEVSSKWGRNQTVTGPVLTVPYETISNLTGKIFRSVNYAHFLPENLKIMGDVTGEVRKRGIYEAALYNSKLILSGNFTRPEFGDLGITAENINWDDTVLTLGISDLKGIKGNINIKLGNKELDVNPGVKVKDFTFSGITSSVGKDVETMESLPFRIEIDLSGSNELRFIPVGKTTEVNLKSNWINPCFCGEYLPLKREIGDSGFSSEWKISHLNRNFPQKFTGNSFDVNTASFGVDFLLPVDQYQKTMRTSKYDFLFIGLTFLTFFLIEVLNKKHIHPFQYIMIGFSLVIFYLLLLSISEQINFTFAYFAGALGSVATISTYSSAVLRERKLVMTVAAVLLVLYGFLFIIIQMQDFALLFGSLLLFAILSSVMYLTRKIDWFELGKQQ